MIGRQQEGQSNENKKKVKKANFKPKKMKTIKTKGNKIS